MKLSVNDVRFGYGEGEREVLRGVTFEYESPDVMCLLGHNGVGKSTLLECIIGANEPSSGGVLIDGKAVSSYKPRELALKFAYIPQTHLPSFSYKVLDVVTMGRTSRMGYFVMPGADDVAFAREQLEYLGISHLAERPYTNISGGERQLVMIASALAQAPDALILDEPTAHLDFGNQYRFVELVERLHDRGVGVVMTTHFPDHALMLGCNTVVLSEGRVIARGPAEQVVTEENMAAIYGIEVHLTKIGNRTVCVPGSLEA